MRRTLNPETMRPWASARGTARNVPGPAGSWTRRGFAGLGIAAAALWVWLGIVFVNHLMTPEITRGTTYESVRRILEHEPLYPAPSPAFVQLDYNPLLYFAAAASARVFGFTPATVRLVAMIGALGVGILIFLAVRRETASAYFGWVAAGLFAGAYRAFDCFLDCPNADTLMLATALAGLYLLEVRQTRSARLAGVLLLCTAFWFKQQGALLAIGGVLYVTWRDGLRAAWPCWVLASLLGPGAYLLLGPRLFGDQFLYYTYEVPRGYQQLGWRTLFRPGFYVTVHWLILALLSAAAAIQAVRARERLSVWLFTFPFALLIGFLGSMDYAENNVYMAPAIWFIILGVGALARWVQAATVRPRALTAAVVALAVSFAVNLYDPRSVLVPRSAWRDYDDLVHRIEALDGLLFMPGVGQLPSGARLPIGVHWVPLEDLVRGPGRDEASAPLVRVLLRDLVHPPGAAYIIANHPLANDSLFKFLAPHYQLVEDLGDRYRSLRGMPGWYSGKSWPRYVYRFRRPQAGDVAT